MPRRARITLVGVPHHVIQRGNNRQACFYCEDDYLFYLKCLHEYSLEYSCCIHAYVLMTNHIHLLITPNEKEGLSKMMKALGQRYTQYINRSYVRTGTLWEGRFKSCITNEANYILACYRYIELNPVRAEMVEHPADYLWTSYHCNAQAEQNELIVPHECYLSLNGDRDSRCKSYRELFKSELDHHLVDEIRVATLSNYALGSNAFKDQVEAALGRRASQGVNGRPKANNE